MATSTVVNSVIQVYKHPTATLDYVIDWSNWLGTDTISTSTWSVPVGITKVSDSLDVAKATIWLSGGTDKVSYRVVNTVTSAMGRTETKSIQVRVFSTGG